MTKQKKQKSKKSVSRMVQKDKEAQQSPAKAAPAPLDPAKALKDFFEITCYQRKQNNNLLGFFVEEKYQISKEFIEKLLELPKKFDHIEENVLYAASVMETFVLNFKIVMEIAPDFCKAQIFLIEIEQGVENDTKHLTLLDEFVEIYSLDFRQHFCDKWNIFYDDKQPDLGELYHYLHLQEEENRFNKQLVEILSQLYVVRMLALLDKLGTKTDKAKFEFKLLMEKHLSTDPAFASDFTMQKFLLDQVLMTNKLFEEIIKTDEGVKILDAYATPLKRVKDKTYPATVLELKTENKTEATPEKKAAPEKGKVKSKGGSPAKGASFSGIDWSKLKSHIPTYSAPKAKPAHVKPAPTKPIPAPTKKPAPTKQGSVNSGTTTQNGKSTTTNTGEITKLHGTNTTIRENIMTLPDFSNLNNPRKTPSLTQTGQQNEHNPEKIGQLKHPYDIDASANNNSTLSNAKTQDREKV